MFVREIELYRADIPFRQVSGAPLRTWQTTSPVLIVRMVGDDGIVGVGTATAIGFYFGVTGGGLTDAAIELAPHLIGLSPFDIERAHGVMDHYLRGSQVVKAAFDIALYDLMGKVTARPVYDLLGGRTQDEPLRTTSFALYANEPEQMAADARMRFDEGFRNFEIKMTDPKLDVARIRAIREAVGDEATLIADANGHWTVKEAIRVCHQMERFNVMVEEPCHGIVAQAEVRRAVSIPIIADETCHTVADAAAIVRERSADIVSIKLMKAGGLWRGRQIATVMESAGLGYRVDGVRGETKLSNTASTHLALSLTNPIAPGLMQHARLAEDIVIDGGLTFADGRVSLSDAPGLGLEVREYGDLLARIS